MLDVHLEKISSDFKKALENDNQSIAHFCLTRMKNYAIKDFTARHLADAMEDDLGDFKRTETDDYKHPVDN
jgi:hypothetical protein